ncbi:MAG: DNA-directed RNA polymerase [Nanoarchaeota archaeon]|nr:DNA-directed RNA polymerase [Nanoarchaeota archaeon]
MYKLLTVKDRVRVPPLKFKEDLKKSVEESIVEDYENKLLDNNRFIICMTEVVNIGEGRIVPGDGAIYYETTFKLLSYTPLIKEVVEGEVTEITDFGAFVRIGPIEGFVHMSQVMDDYVSFSKTKSLLGKESKKTLSIGDYVRARVIAISMKSLKDAKIGLTMRQPGLGKLEWIEADKKVKAK